MVLNHALGIRWIFDRVHHEINELCSAKTVEQVYITEFMQLDELLMQVDATNPSHVLW